MRKQELSIGQVISFGRPNGEKTLGKIITLGPKRALVQTLESRGIYSPKPSGIRYRVGYEFMYPSEQTHSESQIRNRPSVSYRQPSSESRDIDESFLNHPLYLSYVDDMKRRKKENVVSLSHWVWDEMEGFDGEFMDMRKLEKLVNKYGKVIYQGPVEPKATRREEKQTLEYTRDDLIDQLYEGPDRAENDDLPSPRDGYWTPKENFLWLQRFVISGRESKRSTVSGLTCKTLVEDLVKYGKFKKHSHNILLRNVPDSEKILGIVFDYTGDNDLLSPESVVLFFHSEGKEVPAAEILYGIDNETLSGNVSSEIFYKKLTQAIQDGLDKYRGSGLVGR